MKKRKRLTLKDIWEDLLIKLFVDNIFLYKIVRCHRLSSRSFFVKNRQFHVCARCTGLLTGYTLSPLFLLAEELMAKAFMVFCTLLILDGTTQLLNLRKSNNILRFITGLGAGTTFLSFMWFIIYHALKVKLMWPGVEPARNASGKQITARQQASPPLNLPGVMVSLATPQPCVP